MKTYTLLILTLILLAGCTQQTPHNNGTSPGNTGTDNTDPQQPEQTRLAFTQCDAENRPEICTMEYNPVCADFDNGIRCITTPCSSTERKTYATGCTACSDPKVYGYWPGGACEDQNPNQAVS